MSLDFDTLDFKLDWPIIGKFKDDIYPYHGYETIRYTARGLIENQDGNFGFLHIVGEDFFGERDHLETCGGGLEENEYIDECFEREALEELGCTLKDIILIGSIIDSYNLIKRITCSTFFYGKVDTLDEERISRTLEEKILIKEILWLNPYEALDRLKNKQHKNKCDLIVQRRDALALEYYLKHTNR